ncbi:MAG: hypothetical protein ABIL58_24250 [Pseudomonadota bacterium]
MAKGKEVMVVGGDFAMMKGDVTEVLAIIQENLAGEALKPTDLDRIKVPSGGSKIWEVPDPMAEDGIAAVKELDCIIIHQAMTRSMWLDDDAKGTPPNCTSNDAVTGKGDPGGDCEACAYAQFGTDKNGRGQKCNLKRAIFFVTPDNPMPMVLYVPAMSLKNAKLYMYGIGRMMKRSHQVITRMSLETAQNAAKDDYSRILFKTIGVLEGPELEAMAAYHAKMAPILSKLDIAAHDTNDAAGDGAGAEEQKAAA